METFKKTINSIYINSLHKLNNKLVMNNDSGNEFYQKYIRWQLSTLVDYLLYGEKTYKNTLRYIWVNKVLLLSSILVGSGMLLMYNLGSSGRDAEIVSLMASNVDKDNIIESQQGIIYYGSSVVHRKDNIIDNLSQFKQSREWLEFKIYQETKMVDFHINMSRVSDDILFLMAENADKYKIPYSIYFRLIASESSYKFIPNSGGSGAFGYMQVMPITFKSYADKLNLKGGHTKENNILVGSYMLYKTHIAWMKRGYDEHLAWEYTLAEYNAGRGKLQIKKDDRVVGYYIPSYTEKYISKIMKTYNEKYRYV